MAWAKMGTQFRTKFIIVSTFSVLIGLLLSGTVALWSIVRLRADASMKIEEGLTAANREYLKNYIEVTAQRTNFMIDRAFADMQMLTQITQTIIDHEDEFAGLDAYASEMPFFKDKLVYNEKGNWYQNGVDEPSVVSVWGHLLDANHEIRPDVLKHIRKTVLLDLIMPAIKANGADKQWLYLVGPENRSYLRLSPYTDQASAFDATYPGHNEQDFWAFFFPGLVDQWKRWISDPASRRGLESEITVTPPYEDAAGSGIITSLFHPLWSKDRQQLEGAIGLDFNLAQIIDFVNDVRLAQTGFAFIANSSGNVLGVSDEGVSVLGLEQTGGSIDKESSGVNVFNRKLGESSIAGIRNLALPSDEEVGFQEVVLSDKPHDGYVFVTRRMHPLNYFADGRIAPEHWSLIFVVPKKEVYASLYGAQQDLQHTTQVILYGQIVIAIGTLLFVFLGVVGVSRTMTRGLIALVRGATEIQKKNYNVNVQAESRDEIGKLSATFNAMAREIQDYTQNLEGLVHERTQDLEEANNEIKALNEQLAEENLRLAAEIDVARRLQTMVLPQPEELEQIQGLDIDGYMKPADEVGGDYYDVLQSSSGITFGVGDVTGHGLESGVLMLMVQTAIRTLTTSGERDPARFLDLVNRTVYLNKQRMDVDRNLSLCLLDYHDGYLTLTGQHEDVIVVRADGRVEIVDTTPLGFPIGLDLEVSHLFASSRIEIDTGDVVILYTDGITEAENDDGMYYGVQRLCEAAARSHGKTAKEIREDIVADVTTFIGKHDVFDDITLLVIKKTDEQ